MRLHPPRTFAGTVSPNGSPQTAPRETDDSLFHCSTCLHLLWSEAQHTRSPRQPVFRARLCRGGRGPQNCPPSEPETLCPVNLTFLSSKPETSPHNPEREAVLTPLGTRDTEVGTAGAPPQPQCALSQAWSLAITFCVSVLDFLTAQLSGGGVGRGRDPGHGETSLKLSSFK